jgi:hypothetical protein
MKQLHKFLKIFIFLQLRLIKLNIQLTLCKHILTKNARKSTTKIKKVLISRNSRGRLPLRGREGRALSYGGSRLL